MIQIVLGPSGSGKTTYMIDKANEEHKSKSGHIVFIDSDDSQMFNLDHAVRLVNAKKYHINTADRLFGLLAGIISRDFDVEKIYIDGIYDAVEDQNDFSQMFESLLELGKENNVCYVIGLEEVPEGAEKIEGIEVIELSNKEK